jgi:hypothetical protein
MNPFDPSLDSERHQIWERLVRVDAQAFVAGDWAQIEDDFDPGQFEGIRCYSANPNDWKIAFATLGEYRDSWLAASREFVRRPFVDLTPLEAVLRRTRLAEIEINGDRCLCHKKFSGTLERADGSTLTGSRQTIYRLHKRAGMWKIVGFLGQLPLDEP